MRASKAWALVFVVCSAALLSGCTGLLWEKERFAHCHWPAHPPNLRLSYSESAQDLLAEYDEQSERTTIIHRRAYWLEPNAAKVMANRQPRFVLPANAPGLVEVPVTGFPANPPASSCHGLCAVVSTDGQSFTLYLGQGDTNVYNLPVYYAGGCRRVKQVLLTPFTVALDATMVGVVIAVAAGHAEAERHYSVSPNSRK